MIPIHLIVAQRDGKERRPSRERATALFTVAALLLAIGSILFVIRPHERQPAPIAIPWVCLGAAVVLLLFGIKQFLTAASGDPDATDRPE